MIERLHEFFPEAQISILVRKGNEAIYNKHPILKETLIWEKTKNKYRNLFALLKKIRQKKYDMVINCHRYASSGFLTAFSGAKHKAGFKQTPFSWMFDYTVKHAFIKGEHEINRYHHLIADFAGNTIAKPKLYPSEQDFSAVTTYKQKSYYCIAPASVWSTKQLPADKWIELCLLIPKEANIYFIGSPTDEKLAEEIITRSGISNGFNLCGKLSLLESAALMKDAKMNFVNDSAPLHLASSMNAPVRAFFCSTVKEFGFYPLSENSQVIEVKNLTCKPCGIHGFASCPKGHFNCGYKIEITQNLFL